jgi:hypothetical protein
MSVAPALTTLRADVALVADLPAGAPITAERGDRPAFDALQAAGMFDVRDGVAHTDDVGPAPSLVVVLPTRSCDETRALFARARSVRAERSRKRSRTGIIPQSARGQASSELASSELGAPSTTAMIRAAATSTAGRSATAALPRLHRANHQRSAVECPETLGS